MWRNGRGKFNAAKRLRLCRGVEPDSAREILWAASRRLGLFRGCGVLTEERGSELIEIALVLPMYFMLVFGLTSFGLLMFAYCNATYAAKMAVRYAVVHSTATMYPCSPTIIQNLVIPFLWGAPNGGIAVNTTWNAANTVGSIVSVTVTLTYNTGLPYVGLSGLVATASSQGYIVH